jgi:hypothetical protein
VMDLTPSIIPKSDQLNADEIMAPVTYTIREVKAGSVEQPFDFMLIETDRAYRPSKTMRRVIVNAWGAEAANYAGRRLTLYREPTIKYGGVEVGGIRISHMSHIDGPVEVMAQTTRGKREKFTVQPLADQADDVPFVPESAAPAASEAETPGDSRPVAAEPAAAATGVGGLQIASEEDAARVIRAMTTEDVKKLRTLLGSNATSKTALAATLYDKRATHYAESIHHELREMEA